MERFPGKLECSFTKDPGTTGNFEVTLVAAKKLIHSKRGGQGRCESTAEREALFAKIEEYIASL